MTAIVFDSTRPVQSAQTFARGIGRRPFVPSQADLDWAAQTFGELEDNRQLEEQALQAQWDDQFNAYPAGCCQMCGRSDADLDPVHGLCDACLDAATDATIACQNRNAMGQYRVF
jgi:hypothetical protein